MMLQTNNITTIQNKQEVITAIFDIDITFDTLHWPTILHKLRDHTLQAICFPQSNNLSNRIFKVSANGRTSKNSSKRICVKLNIIQSKYHLQILIKTSKIYFVRWWSNAVNQLIQANCWLWLTFFYWKVYINKIY